MSKYLRGTYFRYNPWVKEWREYLGPSVFDAKYRALFKFLSSLHPGQYFRVTDVCRSNPEYHDLVVCMCDLYYNMDFFINLEYNEETDMVMILSPFFGEKHSTGQVDVYSKIVKDPKAWGADPCDL